MVNIGKPGLYWNGKTVAFGIWMLQDSGYLYFSGTPVRGSAWQLAEEQSVDGLVFMCGLDGKPAEPVKNGNSTIEAESKITDDAILPAEPVSSDDELRKKIQKLRRARVEAYVQADDKYGLHAENIRDLADREYENGLVQLLHSYGDTREIDVLEKLREQTKEVTHPDAFVSDIDVAQSIRVHTNSLIEHRLAELKKMKAKPS